jgi:hypothetical protein
LTETGSGTGLYKYPYIAIPTVNVTGTSYSAEDVIITVKKEGSTDYLVDTSKLNVRNNAAGAPTDEKDPNYYKESAEGTIGGFFVFRPTGTFTSNDDKFMENADSKDEASGEYVVTYDLNGAQLTFVVTVGDVSVGKLNMPNAVSYKSEGTEYKINKDNLTPAIPAGNYVTIRMDDVTYDGENEGFENSMNGFAQSSKEGSVAGAKGYMWENATVTLYRDGSVWLYSGNTSVNTFDLDGVSGQGERTYSFKLTESGTYKIEIMLKNPYTNKGYATATIEFTYDVEAANGVIDLSTVWGVILIILSVGLLGGVVFYFIKTGRETKFGGATKKLVASAKPESPVKEEKPKEAKEPEKNDAE